MPEPHAAEWVFAVERAYVAAATGGAGAGAGDVADFARAAAACGAVASRYLAVGTPRTFGLVVDAAADVPGAALSLAAHRAWFAPRDVRCASTGAGAEELAAATNGRVTSVAEAFAADIVCVHAASVAIDAALLRRGTHVNALVPGARLAPDLARLAAISRERTDLPALAAGLVDGRQLDELTVFVLVDAAVALAALATAARTG